MQKKADKKINEMRGLISVLTIWLKLANVMCTYFHHESVLYILPSHAEEREQETVANSVPPLANITDGTTHTEG